MKRLRYEPQVKASIIAAVEDARKSGKTWVEALAPAQAAGYKGNVDSLTQLVRNSTSKKKSTAKKAMAKPAVKAPVSKTPAANPASAHLDISALVHKTVTDAVVNALEALLTSIKG